MLNAARCVTPAWTMRSGLRCRGMAGCWRSSTGVRSSWPRWPADGSARWPAAGLHLRSFRQFRSVVGRHAAAGLVAADRGHAAGGAAGAGLGRRQPPPAGGGAR
ncbi:hypothetical protein G6F60_014307 [Rhizopus arrhizus]|nr:hypothetical protein G6F60_014307 [Rhizopus arrhizus]